MRFVAHPHDRQLHEWHWDQGRRFWFQSEQYQQGRPTVFRPLSSRLGLILVQLADTQSATNATLLHFLERAIYKHFSNMEEFLDELAKPAETYRGLCLLYKKHRSTDTIHSSERSGYSKGPWRFEMV